MSDETLATKTLRDNQTLSDAEAREVINAMLGIIRDTKARRREQIAAARVLVGARRADLDASRTSATIEMGDIEERLKELEERYAAVEQGNR